MKLPGWVIGLVLALLATALEFLQGEQFTAFDWAPYVVVLLTTLVSVLRLWNAQQVRGVRAASVFAAWWLRG